MGMQDPILKIPEEGMRQSFGILEFCSLPEPLPLENTGSRAGRTRPDPAASSTNSTFPKLHSSFSQRTKLDRISQENCFSMIFRRIFLTLGDQDVIPVHLTWF